MNTRFLVTVDTEEDNAWAIEFRAHGQTVENVRGLNCFQDLCDKCEVRPTYLVDTPVADDPQSSQLLAGLQTEARCEIGAHLHPWCAPPVNGKSNARQSFMCNLPEELQREKLVRLTETISN